jgi:hypothetical protein
VASSFEQLDDAHQGLGIKPGCDAETPSIGQDDLDAADQRLGLLGEDPHGEESGLGLIPALEFPTPAVKGRLVEALSLTERGDGQSAPLPTGHDLPPVRLAAHSRVHRFGHGSPPFGHAKIVAWAARRGSPDAHEVVETSPGAQE